jgi:hypothetical protein
MKTKIIFLMMCFFATIKSQSMITLGANTALTVGSGADICAGSIQGPGTFSGNGTFCGNPTDVESEDEIALPKEFALDQNFPNPFNPGTKISWQSPVSSHQTLKVYDMLGNEVATLVDEYREAGLYEIKFDASKLSSGVYLYRLQADNYTFTRKMTLIK